MSKKMIYICSPCRGDYEKNMRRARGICYTVMTQFPDVIPIAPHVYFPQFLDDTDLSERLLGMDAGIALLNLCDEIWVYGLDNPSEGMQAEIDHALKSGIPIRDGFNINETMKLLKTEEEAELGDALLVLPSHIGNINGVAAIESTTVRISGEVIMELAQTLRRNRGSDVTVEAERNPRVDRCVYCGEIVPEGRQVCPTCERKWGTRE